MRDAARRDTDDRSPALIWVQVGLQCGLAALFVAGVYAGLFNASGWPRGVAVAYISAWHVAVVAHVTFRSLAGRRLRVADLIPFGDTLCILAAWIALGDPGSAVWSVYMYALMSFSSFVAGRRFLALAVTVLAQLLGGALLVRAMDGVPLYDANLVVMLAITACTAAVTFQMANAWRRAQDEVRRLAETDPLTGIANRRTFLERLEHVTRENRVDVSLLMLDLDDFKALNDQHGHPVGDQVLVTVAGIISGHIRGGDLVGRYGGEEFIVVLAETGPTGASIVAERLRMLVRGTTPCTVSIGCASRRPGEPAEEFIRRADDLLLRAKQSGKNLVLTDQEPVAERAAA